MADYYTVEGALQNQQFAHDSVQDGSKLSGDLKVAKSTYTLTGSEADTETIGVVKLPAGARVIPELSSVYTSADPGTTLALDIGYEANADGLSDNLVLSAVAGGSLRFDESGSVPAAMFTDEIVAEGGEWVQATFMSPASLTASVKLRFVVAYSVK